MGFLDRLFGAPEPEYAQSRGATRTARTDDEIALERYRYLLRTAPPENIERVHAEAFAQLTPQQRAQLFEELSRTAPAGEAPRSDDAQALAASATRSELRQPGYLERTMGPRSAFGGAAAGGPSFGSMFASSLLGSVAGYVIGSAIMSAFLPDPYAFDGADASGVDAADGSTDAAASADASGAADSGGDWFGGSGDFGGGDFGGDFGDF